MRGFKFPLDELRYTVVKGSIVEDKKHDTIYEAIINGVRVQNYKNIKCPALAIYGQRNTAEQWFPSYPYMDSKNQQKAVNDFMPEWNKYYAEEVNRFKNEVPHGLIKEIPGADHYVFLTNPEETEKLVRDFINGSKEK
jgi:pimeloyl-ACP methyl ester carboxylesterase